MIELGADELCGKGYELALLLFSDILEIAKRRSSASKGLGLKSPSTMSLRSVGLNNGGAGFQVRFSTGGESFLVSTLHWNNLPQFSY